MSVVLERIKHLLGSDSIFGISKKTGIPKTTLYYTSTGARKLPEKWAKTFRNYFERVAYSELRDAGASVSQAERFKWQSVSKLEETTNLFQERKDSLIEMYTSRLVGLGETYEEARKKAEDSITIGMQKSHKTLEFIIDNYPKSIFEQSETIEEI